MRKSLLGAGLCIALVASACSKTYKVPREEPIATVQIPDKWKTDERGEYLEAISADDAMHFLVFSPEAQKVAEGVGEVMRYIRNMGGIVVRPDSRKDEPGKLNGAEIHNISWQAKNQAGEVSIRFTVITLTGNKPLLVAHWGSPAAEEKHRAELNKMLRSIRKI